MSTRFIAGSDASLLVDLGFVAPAPEATARVLALFRALLSKSSSPPPWLRDVKPAYTTLLVEFDPRAVAHGDVEAWLRAAASAPFDSRAQGDGAVHDVPVVYDGADLAHVAATAGLSAAEVVALHSAPAYTVAFLGFMPGFAYLLGLDARLAVPRRGAPRTEVPAGSVAVGGHQTALYPSSSPGGWHLLGRAAPPASASWCAPGDRVRFRPVDALASSSADARAGGATNAPASLDALGPLRILSGGGLSVLRAGAVYGRAHLGFSVGGPADARAHAFAHAAVGNRADAVSLEVTLQGPVLRADADADVCVAGAPVSLAVDGAPQPMWRRFRMSAGATLRVGVCTAGLRAYIAARSVAARSVAARCIVDPATTEAIDGAAAAAPYARLQEDAVTLRVTDGAHMSAGVLEGVVFTVRSDSDRRGVRLAPASAAMDALRAAGGEVVSEGVSLGTVQLPASGEPIVLGVDRTSTGGYKKAASVISADAWMLGQLRPGARVRFSRVTLADAAAALRADPGEEERG